MNKKFLSCLLLSSCLVYNVYSMNKNSIGICREEKLYGDEYRSTNLEELRFERIRKLTLMKKGSFDDNKKLKKLVFEHDDIDITLPNGFQIIPSILNPANDLALPLDCHVMLKSEIEESAQKIEHFRKLIKEQTGPKAITNFARSLQHMVRKHALNHEEIEKIDLEIKFFIANECSKHNWYLDITDHSYTAVSYLSETNATYRDVVVQNTINDKFDMAKFYRSTDYKFALTIYELLSAVSTIDSGNVYERTLNAIINATQDQYTISMCNAIKDAYMLVENLDAGIRNLERQICEEGLEKQRTLEQERVHASEQKRIREAEKMAAKEAKRIAEMEKQESIKKTNTVKNEQASTGLKSKFNATAFVRYRRAANQGDANSQFNLGVMYENGYGVEQNYIEAVRWYRLAADQGIVRAQSDLGVMYENGYGVEQNYTEAVRLFRLAADQGLDQAQNNLGYMYFNGHGVEQNYVESVRLFRLAADQGYARAQFNLGVMYFHGHGVEQNYVEPLRLFRLAADQGMPQAQFNLGVMYESGEGVEQDYAEAIKWYKKAADQGYVDAQAALNSISVENLLNENN